MFGVDPYGRDWLLRILVVIWIAVLIFLAAIAARTQDAHADPISNPSTATDGLLYAAVAAADDYWRGLGQPPRCDHPPVYVYDEVGELASAVAARATVGGCDVYFERGYVRGIRRNLARPWGWKWRRMVLENICAVAAHERGHNLGLDHDAGGVMSAWGAWRAGSCIAWAARLEPATKAQPKVRAMIGRQLLDKRRPGH